MTQDRNYKNYELKVLNSETGNTIDGKDWNDNYIRYAQAETPHIIDVIPNQVYAGQEIQFLTITNWAASTGNNGRTQNRRPVEDIKIGSFNTDMDLITASTRNKWAEYGTAFTVTVGAETLPSRSETPVARYRTGNSVIRESALHCNFAGDDCWYVRVLPRIDEISPAFGSLAGGQELTISGWGITGQVVEVEVDGVPCTVQSSSATQIKCITGEKAD